MDINESFSLYLLDEKLINTVRMILNNEYPVSVISSKELEVWDMSELIKKINKSLDGQLLISLQSWKKVSSILNILEFLSQAYKKDLINSSVDILNSAASSEAQIDKKTLFESLTDNPLESVLAISLGIGEEGKPRKKETIESLHKGFTLPEDFK